MKKPVVQRLLKLMEFRNSYPAFDGEFNLFKSKNTELIIEWVKNDYTATAHIDTRTFRSRITYSDPVASRVVEFDI